MRSVTQTAHQVAARTARGARGAAVEVAWITAHLATYPLGLISERYVSWSPADPFGLLRRRADAVGTTDTPVLLVHGLADNRSVFTVLARELRRHGFSNVFAINHNPFPTEARSAAVRLAEEIERICQETGHDRLNVVGHSLGGLLTRYYVQRLGGDERTSTLVTLGTPHHGTKVAKLLPYRLPGQLLPDSELMAELAAPAPACRTRFVCFWSDLDQMMSPRETAALDHPDLDVHAVVVEGVGHMSLPVHRDVVETIIRLLRDDPSRG